MNFRLRVSFILCIPDTRSNGLTGFLEYCGPSLLIVRPSFFIIIIVCCCCTCVEIGVQNKKSGEKEGDPRRFKKKKTENRNDLSFAAGENWCVLCARHAAETSAPWGRDSERGNNTSTKPKKKKNKKPSCYNNNSCTQENISYSEYIWYT